MRALRLGGIILGVVVVGFVLLLLAALLFVNPNDYKGRIAQRFRQSTGRELTLAGDLKLSVFPWVALELGPASVGNPPGFGTEPFASVRHAALRVRLLPLLRHELQIGRLQIDGLDVHLRRDAGGRGNWQSATQGPASPEMPVAASGSRPGAGPLESLELEGVTISDSRIRYEDSTADQVSLEVGHLTAGVPVPIELKLRLTTGAGAAPSPIDGKLSVTMDPAHERYQVAGLEITGTFTPKGSSSALPWRFRLPEASADLSAQRLDIPGFEADLADAHVTGKLTGEHLADTPAVGGELRLQPVSPRALASALAVALPATRDPKALTRLAAGSRFAYGSNALRLDGIDLTLDDSELRGQVAISDLERQTIQFELALDRINIDRYLSPSASASAPPAKPAEAQTTPHAASIKGNLTIGSVTVSGLTATQVLATLESKGGITHIAPAKARLYGGEYSGDITLDQSGAVPAYRLEQSMTGVDVAALLKDFAKTQRLSGRGTISSSLRAQGAGSEALRKSLSGHVAASLENGAVEGFDLWYQINRALALVQKQSAGAGNDSGRTRFDSFKASADIASGVATTRDLNIISQNLRVTGQGTANLVTEAIHYDMRATVLSEPSAQGTTARRLADIPVAVTGTLSAPKVSPDLEAMGKTLLQQPLENQLKSRLKGLLH